MGSARRSPTTAVSGSHDAGIYVGDSLDANAVVSHNRSWDNALGILVRHARKAVVSDNEAWGNCLGVFLLADGQAGGSGQTAVLNNTVAANNEVCTQFAAGGVPARSRRRRHRPRGVAAQRHPAERRERQPRRHAVLGRHRPRRHAESELGRFVRRVDQQPGVPEQAARQ